MLIFARMLLLRIVDLKQLYLQAKKLDHSRSTRFQEINAMPTVLKMKLGWRNFFLGTVALLCPLQGYGYSLLMNIHEEILTTLENAKL